MKPFFRDVLRQMAVTAVALAFSLALIFCGILAIGLVFGDDSDPVRKGSILVFDLRTAISDTPPEATLSDFLGDLAGPSDAPYLGLRSVIDAIDEARRDDRITGLVLYNDRPFDGSVAGFAALTEIRGAISRFAESGKPVTAHLTNPSLGDYYLASAGGDIAIHPMGEITFPGLAAEGLFVGGALEKYGVEVQLAQIGNYKSAGERFTREGFSPESREELNQLLGDLWDDLLPTVAMGRGLEPATLRALARDIGYFDATDALIHGLADRELNFDELLEELLDIGEYDEDHDTVRQITLASYADATADSSLPGISFGEDDTVAVVYAEGEIVSGEGDLGQVGGDWFARELRRLRLDDSVGAVVLRVNSPGGSAVASEVIGREVRLLSAKKPVVVSMGDMAASGGYWISADADVIYASNNTLTGSIGVIGILMTVQELGERFGVTFDGVKTGPFADLYTMSHAKTDEEMEMIRDDAREIYRQFLANVSSGRGLPVSEVEKIAEGRVWSGRRAREIGLVDEIGTLHDAIAHAGRLAGLDDYRVRDIPAGLSFDGLIESLFMAPPAEPPLIRASVTEPLRETMEHLHTLGDPRGVYARMPFQIRVY